MVMLFSKAKFSDRKICLLFFFAFLVRTSSEITSTTSTEGIIPITTSEDTTMSTAKGNLKVTLAIFSGRPDPEWQVLTSDPNYEEIKHLLDIARSGGFIYRHKDMPSRLGYKGFLVLDTAKEKAHLELIVGPQTVQLQQLLLKTIPDDILSKDFCKKISEEIDAGAVAAEVQGGK